MYLWKYWRDTRVRFIILLMLVAAIWLLQLHRRAYPIATVLYWEDFTTNLRTFLFLPCLLALGLGISGPGDEFAQRTADFLFTRPRTRRYFIWASWAAGALQILAIVSVYVLAAFLAAVYVSRTVYTWKFLALILPVFLVCIVAYSIICFMTALLRSGQKGYASGLVFIAFYLALNPLLQIRWSINLPYPSGVGRPFAYLVRGAHAPAPVFHFPVAGVVGWTLFAVACPLLGQLYLERREV